MRAVYEFKLLEGAEGFLQFFVLLLYSRTVI